MIGVMGRILEANLVDKSNDLCLKIVGDRDSKLNIINKYVYKT